MKTIKHIAFIFLALLLSVSTFGSKGEKVKKSNRKPNVLFIVVDDLKPEIGCYGSEVVKTPNIDQLAKTGVLFENAYCQQAVCAPSRISAFTGMRPDQTGVLDLKTNMRDMNPDIVTIPEYFKQNGYETAGLGKLMHGAKNNDPQSWTIPYKESEELEYAEGYSPPAHGKYQNPEAIEAMKFAKVNNYNWFQTVDYLNSLNLKPAVESKDVPDDAYVDGAVATNSAVIIEELAGKDKPFFFALGINRPHLPFAVPKKYWDMYERSEIEIHPFQEHAANSPDLAYHPWGELRSYSDIPDKGDLSADKQKELIHGYFASTSFADAQIGLVLDKLKELGIEDNTIVVLWGDHGWHLGDHGLWCKHSNFEQATRVPFIIRAPGMSSGNRAETMTEMIDIFPTLAEYAGIPVPENLEGASLMPVMENTNVRVKNFALSQFPRGKKIMGYSMRTGRYRLTLWLNGEYMNEQVYLNPDIHSIELYDYKTDPLEKISQAHNPEYKQTVEALKEKLLDELKKQDANLNLQSDHSTKIGTTESSNVVLNETFDAPLANRWVPIVRKGADIKFSTVRQSATGNNAMKAEVISLGENPWDAQNRLEKQLNLEAGKKYKIGIKYNGADLKLVLKSNNKPTVRAFSSGSPGEFQFKDFTVAESGQYNLMLQYASAGEYLIDQVEIIELNKAGTGKSHVTNNGNAGHIYIETFDKPINNRWKPIIRNGAEINFSIDAQSPAGKNALKAEVIQLGKNTWDNQLALSKKIKLEAGKPYTLLVKYVGDNMTIALKSENGKHIVKKFEKGDKNNPLSQKITVTESGNYNLKIQFLSKGVYHIDKIQLSDEIGKKGTGAVARKVTKGFKAVPLNSSNIHVAGANYVYAEKNKLHFSRFSEDVLALPQKQAMFSAEKARTNSGIKIRFATTGNYINLEFTPGEGTNRGSEFAVLQNGKLWRKFKFSGELGKKPMVLNIKNAKSDRYTQFEVVLPSWSDVALTHMEIEKERELFSFKSKKKKTYLAIGNSITHGVGQGSASYLTYPYLLAEKLGAEYYNLAVGGAKVSQAIAEMTAELPEANFITILIGYNDMAGASMTVDQYVANYTAYLKEIRKNQPKATIYCISLAYTRFEKNEKTGATPDDFRNALKKLVEDFIANGDKKLVFVDGKSISSEANLREDNPKDIVHFGIEGAALFADELYKIIAK